MHSPVNNDLDTKFFFSFPLKKNSNLGYVILCTLGKKLKRLILREGF